jgi:hypothetical protein
VTREKAISIIAEKIEVLAEVPRSEAEYVAEKIYDSVVIAAVEDERQSWVSASYSSHNH